MRIAWAFLAHEARIQYRSVPYRLVVLVFLVAASAPVVSLYLQRFMAQWVPGSGAYAEYMMLGLPMLTALLAAFSGISSAVRALEDHSLDVLGITPISNSGFVIRRWMAAIRRLGGWVTFSGRGCCGSFLSVWLLRRWAWEPERSQEACCLRVFWPSCSCSSFRSSSTWRWRRLEGSFPRRGTGWGSRTSASL